MEDLKQKGEDLAAGAGEAVDKGEETMKNLAGEVEEEARQAERNLQDKAKAVQDAVKDRL